MQTTPRETIADFTARGWWGDQTLVSMFRRVSAERPSHLALVDPINRASFTDGAPLRLTFAQVDAAAAALSARLFAAGLRRDDIALVQLPNIAELPIVYLAAARLGVILSPVPVQYGPFELGKARDLLEPRGFITTANCKGKDPARVHAVAVGERCRVLAFGDNPPASAIPLSLAPVDADLSTEWEHYVRQSASDANDVLTLCWTSGTTGQPKCVPRTHNQWVVSASGVSDIAHVCGSDVMLCPFPFVNMASVAGFLFPWVMTGATLVLHQPMDLPVFLQQIAAEHVTYTIAPPAILTTLLKSADLLRGADLTSLRTIGSGGAPLSEWLVRTFEEQLGIVVLNMFGSNEGISLSASAVDLPDPAQRAGYFPRFGVGDFAWRNPVASMVRTRLADVATGEEVSSAGTPGELLIWGPSVFDGYWRAPETNAQVFTADGYFRTGDLFEIAGDGELARLYRFVGRCKDIIVRGGMKISPDEIDRELAGHPAIADVAVVGYEDEVLHERVGAVVVTKPGRYVTLADLVQFLRERGMAAFKFPERLELLAELPRNATGKVQRNQLRELFRSRAHS
jgi:acyl-CoA synthetase (AMP-forming)/AMP-acid ligase II